MRHPSFRKPHLRGRRTVWVTLLLAVAMTAMVALAAGCGSDSSSDTTATTAVEAPPTTVASETTTPDSTTEPAAAPEKTLVDMGGNTVVVPAKVDRIVITCQGGAIQEVAVLGGADKVVSLPSQQKFTTLLKAYPGLAALPEVGTFDNVNLEALLDLEPDVVIASKSSMKGNESIRNAGIPVVEINTGANNEVGKCQKEFELIGELLGDPETAAELVSFWDERLQAITDRLKDVSEDARVRVFYALGDLTHTNGDQAWGQALITAAGGINVAEEMGSMKDTDLEQVIKWDPAAMILSSNEGRFMTIAEVVENPQFRGVKAVEDKRVFLCPVGGFWWDRPSPEAILGITWLAKTLYPEQCADIDLEDLTKEFFKRFYDYDLSTTEYEAFLAPTS